jgi:hypothetical protein
MARGSSASSSSAWRTLSGLSWADRGLLLEATAWLAVARLTVLLVAFRRFSRHLGAHMAESPLDDDPARGGALRRVAWALAATSRRVPWRCQCLEQAIAGKLRLRARGIPNTLYLGVARGADEPIQAHAWLRSGAVYVTGGHGGGRYAVISTFADRTPDQ